MYIMFIEPAGRRLNWRSVMNDNNGSEAGYLRMKMEDEAFQLMEYFSAIMTSGVLSVGPDDLDYIYSRVNIYNKFRSAWRQSLARDHAVAAVPDGTVLVDAGALADLDEKLNMARRWGYGTRHQWRYCRMESVFPNGMADLVLMIDALRGGSK